MLSLASLLLLAASLVISWLTLKAGVYRRIPYEHYILLSGSIGVGIYAWRQDPSWVTGGPIFIVVLVAGFLVWYVHWGSVFPRSELRIRVGDRFPDFSLPDSDGKTITADDLGGKQSALYLFYRGDW